MGWAVSGRRTDRCGVGRQVGRYIVQTGGTDGLIDRLDSIEWVDDRRKKTKKIKP